MTSISKAAKSPRQKTSPSLVLSWQQKLETKKPFSQDANYQISGQKSDDEAEQKGATVSTPSPRQDFLVVSSGVGDGCKKGSSCSPTLLRGGQRWKETANYFPMQQKSGRHVCSQQQQQQQQISGIADLNVRPTLFAPKMVPNQVSQLIPIGM